MVWYFATCFFLKTEDDTRNDLNGAKMMMMMMMMMMMQPPHQEAKDRHQHARKNCQFLGVFPSFALRGATSIPSLQVFFPGPIGA